MKSSNQMFSNYNEDSSWGIIQTLEAVFLLLVVGYFAYGLFFAPAIYMDDWTSVIERIVTDNAQWLDITQRRPLLFSTFLLQNKLLGLNISAYYISLWLLYILMALLLYAIIIKLPLPYKNLFGLITAILFLIYPTNYNHMWLIMFGVYCGTVLTLTYGYLLLRFAQGGSWLTYVFALFTLLLPLGIYEGQVGIAAAWAFMLFLLYFRQNSTVRRISLLIPIVLMGIYALWRTFGYQATGVADQYIAQVSTSPQVLLSRLLLGYKVTLGWGWTSSIAEFLPWASNAKIALLLMFGIVAVLWFICWLVFKVVSEKRKTGENVWSTDERWQNIYPYLVVAVFGILLLGAGYVPTITVFLPSLSGIGSRFNMFATIGGALFIAAVLMIGSILFSRNSQQIKYLFGITAVPFIIVGIITQASVQYHSRLAWREQQIIWHELFSAAPGFENDTFVLFILPGFENRTGFVNWKRTPLSASWEATSGTRLLYNNATLHADVFFPDIDEPIEPFLTSEGVLTQETLTLTPYSKVVAFAYDSYNKDLKQLIELPAHLIQDSDTPMALCPDCVVPEDPKDVPLREKLLD